MEEIKKAYRTASIRYHPNKGGNQEIFQQIGNAYQILVDPIQRYIYDNTSGDIENKLERVEKLIKNSHHKRSLPLIFQEE